MGQITVRALWPMPGVPDGSVLTVEDGERLRALIAAGRYELLGEDSARPGPEEPTQPKTAVRRRTRTGPTGSAEADDGG